MEGWNRLNGTQIYVSRGIGKVVVPIRVACPRRLPSFACTAPIGAPAITDSLSPMNQAPGQIGGVATAAYRLRRELGLAQATALAITDMVGIGPYITIPLLLATMGGPQAMLGWLVARRSRSRDGLVWAELGAALPKAGAATTICAKPTGPRAPDAGFHF